MSKVIARDNPRQKRRQNVKKHIAKEVVKNRLQLMTYPKNQDVLRLLSEDLTAKELSSEEIYNLARDMSDYASDHNALGLAAPQIGINKRLIIVKLIIENPGKKTGEDLVTYVPMGNPVITKAWGQTFTIEGCLSLPDKKCLVGRKKKIDLDFNIPGVKKRITRRFQDLDAIVVQHEIDHLDGRLIIDP